MATFYPDQMLAVVRLPTGRMVLVQVQSCSLEVPYGDLMRLDLSGYVVRDLDPSEWHGPAPTAEAPAQLPPAKKLLR